MTERQTGKILIVDDESDIVSYLSALLKEAGYDIIVARNGLQAMEEVQRERPLLVSLDMSMPEKSGVKFYREMRENAQLKEVPIIIVTGVTNPWAGPDGIGGFEKFISSRKQVPPPDGFFEKPVDADKYLAKIAELLDRS